MQSIRQPIGQPPALVFDHVTVVDVEHGKLLSAQRVVVIGNHIQTTGTDANVRIPRGARVIDARGKYLIPGLWDMHVHPSIEAPVAYRIFVAYGVTGIRDAGSLVPLATLHLWRQEILAGQRVGPPRQLLSGQSITGPWNNCNRADRLGVNQTCVKDSADAVHYVDSLKAAGADMIKPRSVTMVALYAAIAAEARRVGLPFGGHVGAVTELEASDYGATIIDHQWGDAGCAYDDTAPTLQFTKDFLAQIAPGFEKESPQDQEDAIQTILEADLANPIDKGFQRDDPTLTTCWQRAIDRFRHNGTWFVPTFTFGWDEDSHRLVLGNFRLGLPLLAGTDSPAPGTEALHIWGAVHNELSIYVQQGLTPLEALQTATLNPAKMLHATDSLGTVATGKLADLVLLDANPLTDIMNTRKIRAVVANGRYFDRAVLDSFLTQPSQDAIPRGTKRL